ncbi:UvrD-helicase domain-containing protein [Larkinella soli]|uniref:UvrD-helicase domain-containing protein n=1 Tax=Larkinella soli TaxID=1770527 RepID=UPI000FFC6CB6|nr:UvrD-helicase domain-containing protein [Larkinella soli]
MFKIYSSSAGSGKTYTLTKEYLKLALRDRTELGKPFESHQYKHILAVTFTNAAANEMKERILKELRILADADPEKAVRDENSLFSKLKNELDIEAVDLKARARAAFHTILHDYSAFSVLTIDSFVQRVVSAFSEDLELPYSFEVEMDTDAVLQTAIDRLLEKVGQEDHRYLSEALEEFYLENATEGRSWYSLAGSLADFSKGQLGDRNYDSVQKLKDLNPGHFRTIRRNLRDHLRHIEADIQRLARQGQEMIRQAGIAEKSFFQGEKGVPGYFRKRAETAGFPEDPNSYVRRAIEEDVWHSGKKNLTPDQLAIEGLKDRLRPLIEEIEQIRAENRQRYLTFQAVEQHLQKVALLKQVKQECDDLLREQNRIHISEFNRLIVRIVTEEPVPFIYERLGEKYHHILIDEFQDTSRLQFVNLLPLIDNNLAYQRFNLAVGDAKQAIYRFRGGDMDQIVSLHSGKLDLLLSAHEESELTLERLSGLRNYLIPDRLATNWRSAESIVEFNNSFFHFLAESYTGTEFSQVTEVFDEEFRQKASKAGIQGHVQVDFIEKPDRFAAKAETDEPDFNTQMVERTLHYIRKAVEEGYSFGDIAVLCRFKRNARLLADHFEANDIPLISEDSLTLQSSERVRFLVALLQLLHQPENRMVRYDMLFLYHRIVNPAAPNEDLMQFMDDMARAEDVEQVFTYLSKLGKERLDAVQLQQLSVYELSEKLSDYFDLFDNERECAYLFRFLDEVLTYSSRYSSHLADFLAYWQTAQEKVSVSTPADRNAVTIQTIHKSKGLEYPVVIIPYADWSFKPRNGDTMWADLEPLGEMQELTIPGDVRSESRRLQTTSITIQKGLDDTPLGPQYKDEVYRVFVECMNMLYVAFTRPTDRIYILSAKQDYSANKDGQPKNAQGIDFWLFNYLNDLRGNCCWEEGRLSYVLFDCPTRPGDRHSRNQPGDSLPVVVGNREGVQALKLRRVERSFGEDRVERSRDWAQKVCTALTMMRSTETMDRTIRQMVAEGKLRASEQNDLQTRLEHILTHPDLSLLFSNTVKSENNRRILVKNGQKSGPNRVVHLPDKVLLVNYLSCPPEEKHRSTLSYYLKLYRQMGYPAVEGWLVLVDGPEIIRLS